MKGVTLNPDQYRVGHSGNLSSDQMTETLDLTRDDLLEAYRQQKLLNERLAEQQLVSTLANTLIDTKVTELNNNAVAATTSYNTMTANLIQAIGMSLLPEYLYPSKFWYTSFNTNTDQAFEGLNYTAAILEKEYGQLVLPAKTGRTWSHIPQIQDENNEYVASPYVHLYLNDQDQELDRESPEYHMVGSNVRTWVNQSSQSMTRTIYITTPPGGRPELNYFTIKPFPFKTFTIDAIEYHNGSGWVAIPRFTAPTTSADNISLHFDTAAYGRQLRVTLTNGVIGSTYYMGVEQIDAGVKDYEDEARIYYKIDDTDGITHITGVDLSYSVYPTTLSNDVSYNPVDIRIVKGSAIAAVTGDENKRTAVANASVAGGLAFSTVTGASLFTRSESPLSLDETENSLYVELILRRVGNTTPVVDYLNIYYKMD